MLKAKKKSNKHLIIIIEEKRLSGRRFKTALPEKEYEIREASTPYQAINDIATSNPSLVLISTEYGAKAVYTFCMKLASKGFGLVILHNKPTKVEVVRATRYGALDLLLRPPIQSTIRPRIERALIKCGRMLPKAKTKEMDFPEDMVEPAKRIEYMLKKTEQVLALPHAVSTVLRLSSRTDTSASHLVPPVESDAAISAAILKSANSVASGSSHRIDNIRGAVARLGMKETTNLVMAQSVFKMFDREGDTFGFDRTEYWVHSLGTACCARSLAPFIEGVNPDNAFLAGLLHDIGKMLLDEYMSTDYQEAVRNANIECEPVRRGETKTFATDHTNVGSNIAKQWKLPEYIHDSIAGHHSYDRILKENEDATEKKDENLPIVRCVSLANQLSKAFGFGHAGDFLVERKALDLWNDLSFTKLDFPTFYPTVLASLLSYLEMMGISAKEFGLKVYEPREETVLLTFPDEDSRYQLLLEAFFVRLGYQVESCISLEAMPEKKADFAVGIAKVKGTMDDVKEVGAKLAEVAPSGIVFADSSDIKREGFDLGYGIVAVKDQMDFYILRDALDKLVKPSEEDEETVQESDEESTDKDNLSS